MEHEKKWWHNAVIYQVYPSSFYDTNNDGIGDIRGIIEKLPYIVSLGVNMIWLNPIFSSPNDDNGYDISDFYGIMPSFGTMADVEELIAKAHAMGIKILFDLVMNHTSDEHPWFIESRKSKENAHRDFYIWQDGKNGEKPTNWEGFFGGSVWEKNAQTDDYYLHLFSKKMPDLNWQSKNLRQAIYDVANFWAEKGVDGLRLDAIIHIAKNMDFPQGVNTTNRPYVLADQHYANLPQVHTYMKEFHQKVLAGGNILTVGEASTAGVKEALQYSDPKNKEFNMIISFQQLSLDYDHSITHVPPKWTQKKMDLVEFKKVMQNWQLGLYEKGWNTLYWNNHDMPRVVSRFGDEGVYHIQSAKMLATLMYLQWGTAFILQGEEIGMLNADFTKLTDYRDVEVFTLYEETVTKAGYSDTEIMQRIKNRCRDNARTPMQWDATANGGFSAGVPWIGVNNNYHLLNVEAQEQNPDSILNYYRSIIKLKTGNACFIYGEFTLLLANDPSIYAYTRSNSTGIYTIICNFTGELQTTAELFEVSIQKKLLGNYENITTADGKLCLRPYEALVFFQDFIV
ncbi:trehalose-6-P hydrolase [Erysipelotrichaceae bacterium]|nr:trehalose-6-P hydrolase [Erysipelotrichaceae bacterium]